MQHSEAKHTSPKQVMATLKGVATPLAAVRGEELGNDDGRASATSPSSASNVSGAALGGSIDDGAVVL
jgi:hypothetical protein